MNTCCCCDKPFSAKTPFGTNAYDHEKGKPCAICLRCFEDMLGISFELGDKVPLNDTDLYEKEEDEE